MLDTLMIGSFILAGLAATTAAIFEWDGFMATPQVKVAMRIFGRDGARIAYIILGVLCIVLAVMTARLS